MSVDNYTERKSFLVTEGSTRDVEGYVAQEVRGVLARPVEGGARLWSDTESGLGDLLAKEYPTSSVVVRMPGSPFWSKYSERHFRLAFANGSKRLSGRTT